MSTMTRLIAGLAIAAGLVACSAEGADESAGHDAGRSVADQQAYERSEAGAAGQGVDPDIAPRQVITTASATVEADDPAAAADDLADRATGLGGWVDGRHTWAGEGDASGPPSASLALRIPAEELAVVIEGLADLGRVQEVSQTSEDVTAEVVDLDARIEALRISTDRLREIMAGATESSDLLEAEAALSERQAELESHLSRREYLAGQVEMSTLTVDLVPTAGPAQVDAGGFVGGLATGWNALLSFVSSLLVVAGALVPWVVVVGVPVVVVLLLVRRRRRRRVAAGERTEAAGGSTDSDSVRG
ncbi:DUF4349 domain-containing protein [Pseudactinotalea sp. HY158]|uniref:DUF4349 domain-containing protein n=1 Tax=Pseudactinotalea sp. HY158 TaxID=2654547 RepID=UPI00129C3D14|nr:DUF4349 domain-containing protein [Pseudactinotalea sp. HY158]QGH70142.1 DUF4349 domain-containing protein [Pseudactinotalea sp. HY158]